jgi:Ca2+-binding RTX toxin-like protein
MAGNWTVIGGRRFYAGDNTNETAIGSAEPETLRGRAGDDALDGGDGDDAIDGDHGNDTLQGGAGNDALWDGTDLSGGAPGSIIGHDSLHGGDGDDILRFFSPDTGDFANGGSGFDMLEVRFTATMPTPTPVTFTLVAGLTSIVKLGSANTVVATNIERAFIFANTGNDILNGGDFADTLVGDDGDDVLRGFGGDDRLEAGRGQVNIFGGAGNDIASFDLSGATTGILLRSGTVIGLSGYGAVRDVENLSGFQLGSGNDRVELDQAMTASIETGPGNDTVVSVNAVSVETGTGNDFLDLGGGADFVDPGYGADLVRLGGGNDQLDYTATGSRAGTDPDTVYGEDGNDAIYTPAGDDEVDGGNGNDTLYAGGGADRIFGQAGDDSIEGEGGADIIRGGAGNDRIGTDYDYWTAATPQDSDAAYGDDGNDSILGGIGADTLDGGVGDDTVTPYFRLSGPGLVIDPFADVIRGGIGTDTLNITNLVSGSEAHRLFLRQAGTTQVVLNGTTIGSAQSFEALQVSVFGDASAAHTIYGGAGNDRVITGNGNDYISGGGGDDTLGDGSYRGAETLLGGDGSDVLNVILDKGDRVFGQDGDDTVNATGLYLGDTLPAAGTMRLDGGAGNDVLNLHAGGRGLIFDGLRITIEGVVIGTVVNFERFLFAGSAGNDSMVGTAFDDVYGLREGNDTTDGGNGADSLDGAAGNDLLNGGNGADTLIGAIGANTLNGGADDDLLTLGADALADVVNGGSGLDTLIASFTGSGALLMTGALPAAATITQGGATILSLTGVDALNLAGAAGNDNLFGGAQADTLNGSTGADTLLGGNGGDLLISDNNQGPDSLDGGGGGDSARIGRSSSALSFLFTLATPATPQTLADGTVVVNVEQANFRGGSGNDTLAGGAFADTLNGGDGADSILGGGGNDSLAAGSGADTVQGGSGNDTVESFTAGAHRLSGDGGSEDQLTLSRFSATDGFLFEADGSSQTLPTGETISGFERGQITGGGGDDSLFGGTLSDSLYGANGDDLLDGGGGNDLLGGDGGADSVAGGAGSDTVQGGDGNDTLAGGADADAFRFFNTTTGGLDEITDFAAEDAVRVFRSGFSAFLTVGVTPPLVANADPAATDAAPTFLFDTDTGDLAFDADGAGAGGPVVFARLLTGGAAATLTAGQIVVE